MKSANLDDFDRAILRLIQQDASLTHAELSEQVNLSMSSIRRRLKILKETGVIEKEVAHLRLDPMPQIFIVTLSFKDETPEAYDALDALMLAEKPVKQFYHISGQDDFMAIVEGPSLQWYEQWARETFMTNPHIDHYSTFIVYSRKKFDTAIDL